MPNCKKKLFIANFTPLIIRHLYKILKIYQKNLWNLPKGTLVRKLYSGAGLRKWKWGWTQNCALGGATRFNSHLTISLFPCFYIISPRELSFSEHFLIVLRSRYNPFATCHAEIGKNPIFTVRMTCISFQAFALTIIGSFLMW